MGFVEAPTFDHAYVVTVWLQAAALPVPASETFCPAETVAGTAMAAMGRRAALIAPGAFAIPAPQVLVVQLHSTFCTSAALAGTLQFSTVVSLETGNVLAPSFRRAMSCEGRRFPFTLVISPAMPATIGAEKLVPRLGFIWSV